MAGLLALVAAFLFAVAATLQQKGALDLGVSADSARSLAGLVRSRWWLAGTGALLCGYAVQAVALDHGRLAIIQPLLVTTVVFALPLGYFLTQQDVGRREIVGAAVIVVGLAAFALFGDPAGGSDNAPNDEWAVALTVIVVGCCILFVLGRRGAGPRKAALFGIVAGVLFGTSACLVKPTIEMLHVSVGDVLSSWELYAMAITGITAFVLQQVSLSTGYLATSVATVSVANPVVSVVLGVLLFDERLSRPPWHIVLATCGLVVAMVGAVMISIARERRGESDEAATARTAPAPA